MIGGILASFLETLVRNEIAKGFKGKLLVGTLSRPSGTLVNEHGDTVQGDPDEYRVEGFIDSYTTYYRKQAGIPEGDSKVVLILGNCDVDPKKDDVVSFPNRPKMKIRDVELDPALAHAECQSFEIP